MLDRDFYNLHIEDDIEFKGEIFKITELSESTHGGGQKVFLSSNSLYQGRYYWKDICQYCTLKSFKLIFVPRDKGQCILSDYTSLSIGDKLYYKNDIGSITSLDTDNTVELKINERHIVRQGWLYLSSCCCYCVNTPIMSKTICCHIPVDVGFMQPKIVCKLCNKELK